MKNRRELRLNHQATLLLYLVFGRSTIAHDIREVGLEGADGNTLVVEHLHSSIDLIEHTTPEPSVPFPELTGLFPPVQEVV